MIGTPPRGTAIRFEHWSSSFNITSEGKHVLPFCEEFPLTIACNRFSFDRRLTPNYHDYFEVSYVYKGTGVFRVGNRVHDLKTGDLLVLGNTELHTLLSHEHDPLYVVSVFFMPELVFRPGGSNLDFEYIRFFYNHSHAHSNHIPARNIDSQSIFRLMEEAYRALRSKPRHHRLIVKNNLYSILLMLLDYYERSPTPEDRRYDKRMSDIRRLRPVFKLVDDDCGERITLEQAAASASMSPPYFCRFFRKVVGCTFMQYLQQARVDRAKQLMLTGNLSVTQIAFEVGFESLSYFCRVFRRLALLSPTEFLRKTEGGHSTPASDSAAKGGRQP